MRIFLFLTLLFAPFFSAQSHKGFRWIDDKFSLFSIDLRTGVLIKETKKDERIELGKIQDWDSIKRELPGDFDINTFHYKNKFLISIPGTGQLYDLDVPNLTLHRLDQTFFRGYNFNANQFIRKDTLFSIGGEGFWQKHSVITFYNPKTLDWELYESKNENSQPTTFWVSGYSKNQDVFFTAFLEADPSLPNKEIPFLTYSFKKREWSTKGMLNDELVTFAKKKYRSVWTGQYLILYKDRGPNSVMILDPFKNILYKYDALESHFFIANSEIYHRNGYLFSREIVSYGKSNKLVIDSISINTLVNTSHKIGKVYETYNFKVMIMVGLLMGVLAIVFGIVFYRKRFKKTITNMNFTELEMIVLKEFVTNPIDKKFTTIEINSLLQINGKSYDNQRQIRNRVISGINKNLYSLFDSREFLCRTANADDKRMMDYFINPEIKQKDLDRLLKHINH